MTSQNIFKTLLIIGLLTTLYLARASHAAGIIYVNDTASGANNGTTWQHAYTDLQAALTAASSGDQIWVAAGTYNPGPNQSDTFSLKNGVALYGGFAGTESNLSERDWQTNVTTLTGDIQGDDDPWQLYAFQDRDSDRDNNNYSVVTSDGVDNTTIVDGFTISDGYNRTSSCPHSGPCGGGMSNKNGSPKLHNIIFKHNSGGQGGGFYNQDGSPELKNVTFEENMARVHGGGLADYGTGDLVLKQVEFLKNYSGSAGGGMFCRRDSSSNSIKMKQVTFQANFSEGGGGGTSFAGGGGAYCHSVDITNAIFSSNRVDSRVGPGGGLQGAGIIRNTVFVGNFAQGSVGHCPSLVTYIIALFGITHRSVLITLMRKLLEAFLSTPQLYCTRHRQ